MSHHLLCFSLENLWKEKCLTANRAPWKSCLRAVMRLAIEICSKYFLLWHVRFETVNLPTIIHRHSYVCLLSVVNVRRSHLRYLDRHPFSRHFWNSSGSIDSRCCAGTKQTQSLLLWSLHSTWENRHWSHARDNELFQWEACGAAGNILEDLQLGRWSEKDSLRKEGLNGELRVNRTQPSKERGWG